MSAPPAEPDPRRERPEAEAAAGQAPQDAETVALELGRAVTRRIPLQDLGEVRDAEWRAGGQVGPLRLLRVLGQGACGVVFAAEDTRTGGRYAVKSLRAAAGRDSRQRFLREGQLLAAVEGHPNTVRVHTAGEAGGRRFLVMELMKGGSLESRLADGPLDEAQAVRLVAALARGLEHVHARGVLHRDLKPANVLFDGAGAPRLVDFGLARPVERGQDLTRSGTILGTPAYMAPEQARGHVSALDARTDVYGLGAVLYHCLTGRPPFEGDLVLVRVRTQPPLAPRALDDALGEDVERVCLRALSKAPDDRYPTAAAFADDLERVARGDPIGRPRRSVPAAAWWAAGALAVVVPLLAGAWALRRADPGDRFDRYRAFEDQVLDPYALGTGTGRAPTPEELSAQKRALRGLESQAEARAARVKLEAHERLVAGAPAPSRQVPGDPTALTVEAMVLAKTDGDAALELVERALRIEPRFMPAQKVALTVLYARSEALAQEAIDRIDAPAPLYARLGRIEEQADRLGVARRDLAAARGKGLESRAEEWGRALGGPNATQARLVLARTLGSVERAPGPRLQAALSRWFQAQIDRYVVLGLEGEGAEKALAALMDVESYLVYQVQARPWNPEAMHSVIGTSQYVVARTPAIFAICLRYDAPFPEYSQVLTRAQIQGALPYGAWSRIYLELRANDRRLVRTLEEVEAFEREIMEGVDDLGAMTGAELLGELCVRLREAALRPDGEPDLREARLRRVLWLARRIHARLPEAFPYRSPAEREAYREQATATASLEGVEAGLRDWEIHGLPALRRRLERVQAGALNEPPDWSRRQLVEAYGHAMELAAAGGFRDRAESYAKAGFAIVEPADQAEDWAWDGRGRYVFALRVFRKDPEAAWRTLGPAEWRRGLHSSIYAREVILLARARGLSDVAEEALETALTRLGSRKRLELRNAVGRRR